MTNEERNDFVSGNFLYCTKDVNTIRKGSGCKQGMHYWFEYVADGNFYKKCSVKNTRSLALCMKLCMKHCVCHIY